MKPEAVLFDVDGTLCNVSSIRHYVRQGRKPYKDFNAFHRESVNCPPNEEVAAAAREAYEAGLTVLVVTARKVQWARHTAMWLAINDIPSHRMYTRAQNDDRPDYEVKAGILARIQTEFTVVHAWDDNPVIIALWQSRGIPTTIVRGWET